ncbi:MAG: GIDE domain-containing protein [Gammaproteobacteria bacterium]
MTEFFASAPPADFFWWTAAAAAAALAAFVGCFVFLHRARLMENMPTSRLRSAAQGYVELEGDARLMEGPPIIAPLTKTRCVWWNYRIEEKQQSGKNSNWVTIDKGRSDDCFELDDGTGKCVVDPDGANVIPRHSQTWYGSSRRPDTSPAIGRGWLRAGFSRYRYVEERLHFSEPLYALGTYRTQAGGPDSFDEKLDLKELLEKWRADKKMMALFDVNKDGTVDQKEWDAARRMAVKKVREEHVQRAVGSTDLHILARPRDGRPYILSGIPQAALIRRWRLSSFACLAVAAGAGYVVLAALLARRMIA